MPESKHSLLVVDDEPYVLDSIYDLCRRDYDVSRASSAAEAKRLLRSVDVHVVLSDQRMPDVDGVELLREIKQEYPDTVRLIFTGYADLAAVVRAINEAQVFRYISKPWNPDEFRWTVQQAAEYYELMQDRKRLIAELERTNEELRTANALKATFLDIASHELNTPAMILLGMSELAAERAEQPDAAAFRRYTHVLHSGSVRLKHLVENMLKLLQAGSFQTELERREVDSKTMLDSVAAQVAPFLDRRRQRLEVRINPPGANLYVDRGKMHDVVLNLLMNAIKFSPDGATIELNVSALNGTPTTLEVADSGVGISRRDLPHIFEPFFSSFDTLHHSSGSFEYGKRGLGMGLAIVKKFVEMHGGTIEVRPRQPHGTSFIIRLPPMKSPQQPS
jgi:signal transduction histidine kinase